MCIRDSLVTDLEQSRVTIEREREELNEYKAQIAQLKSEPVSYTHLSYKIVSFL